VATAGQWLEGARPRTLPAAVAPVAVGTGLAAGSGTAVWSRAGLALLVALALQVAVNYANDYSDGVRGTDTDRVGPLRLVGSGAASPRAVRGAALAAFAVAGAAGIALAAATTWWLLGIGAAAILAAWLYTGGKRPYGYRGFGEIAVFVFFGLVAVVGTAYVQTGRASALAVLAAVPVGLLAVALLVVNNLRDLRQDRAAGKRTLAVVLGDRATRQLYGGCLVTPFVIAMILGLARPWSPLALLAAPLALPPLRLVVSGGTGGQLVPALRETGRLGLAYGLLLAIGLAVG